VRRLGSTFITRRRPRLAPTRNRNFTSRYIPEYLGGAEAKQDLNCKKIL